MLFLWAVFVVGPNNAAFPAHLHHPVVWRTEADCKREVDWLLSTGRITFTDPDYHLECREVPDLRGEPA